MSQAASLQSRVAEQFDTAEQQVHSAMLGMWIFLATEVMFFGGLFTGYTVYRYLYFDSFAEGSRHLDQLLGGINTGVLLTSSLTMALAVSAAQAGRRGWIVVCLLATVVFGSAFLGIKGYEYWHKYETHLVPGASFQPKELHNAAVDPANLELFFSFYFAMTGLHALHMVIGIGLLLLFAWLAWRGRFDRGFHHPVEIMGLYWHFVDIIWIFLFPLLYLVER